MTRTAAPHTARMTDGRSFAVAEGRSILDCAMDAGITLAHSCRTGRCGTCRGRILSGSTVALGNDGGLSEADLAEGWLLTCARAASSDIDLELEDLGNLNLAAARTLPCRIHSLDLLSSDVLRAVLRLPPNSNFEFQPGQYINVIGRGGIRRSYSIANAPAADQRLELHIRNVDNGVMSRYWFETAKVNDLLRLTGPLGTFVLRDASGMDLVFLATGTGIAPVKAMLEALSSRQPSDAAPRSVTVAWGGRHRCDLYWDPQVLLRDGAYIPVLSRPDPTWDRDQGHVQDAILRQKRDWERTMVYACGSIQMIESAREHLVQAGLSSRNFHSDAFVCSASV